MDAIQRQFLRQCLGSGLIIGLAGALFLAWVKIYDAGPGAEARDLFRYQSVMAVARDHADRMDGDAVTRLKEIVKDEAVSLTEFSDARRLFADAGLDELLDRAYSEAMTRLAQVFVGIGLLQGALAGFIIFLIFRNSWRPRAE